VKENPGEVPIGAAGDDRLPFALLVQAAGGNPQEINFVAYEGGGEQTAALLNGDIAAAMAGVSGFRGQV
jgi:putative tricarboxylic transport membrane protein